MRRSFASYAYNSLQQTENAHRCGKINAALDHGVRVFGDPDPMRESLPHQWVEVDEALTPYFRGLDVRTKRGVVVKIYAYASGPEAVAEYRPEEHHANRSGRERVRLSKVRRGVLSG